MYLACLRAAVFCFVCVVCSVSVLHSLLLLPCLFSWRVPGWRPRLTTAFMIYVPIGGRTFCRCRPLRPPRVRRGEVWGRGEVPLAARFLCFGQTPALSFRPCLAPPLPPLIAARPAHLDAHLTSLFCHNLPSLPLSSPLSLCLDTSCFVSGCSPFPCRDHWLTLNCLPACRRRGQGKGSGAAGRGWPRARHPPYGQCATVTAAAAARGNGPAVATRRCRRHGAAAAIGRIGAAAVGSADVAHCGGVG